MAAHRYLRLHTGGRISRPDPVRSRCRGVVPPQRTLDLSADARPDGTAFARVPVRRSAAAPNFRGADERRGIRQAIAAGDRHRPACQAFRPAAGNLYRTNTRYRDLGTAAPGNRAECGKRQEGSGSQPAMVEKFLGQKLHLRRNAGHRHGIPHHTILFAAKLDAGLRRPGSLPDQIQRGYLYGRPGLYRHENQGECRSPQLGRRLLVAEYPADVLPNARLGRF